MGAGSSNEGRVIHKGRALDPSHKDRRDFKTELTSGPNNGALKIPEVTIRTITWTRESHGLFDFEVKESERKLFEKKMFKIKGSHQILRKESEVTTRVAESNEF